MLEPVTVRGDRAAVGGVFERVLQQVGEHLREPVAIALDQHRGRWCAGLDLDPTVDAALMGASALPVPVHASARPLV